MKKIFILIGLVLCMFLISGAGQRIYWSQYEERCYEHDRYDESYCNGYWSWTDYEYINESWKSINLTEPICKCGAWFYASGCLQTKSVINESRCLEYHLVRKA